MRMLLVSILVCVAPIAMAQTSWDAAVVGHGRVLDVATNGEHAWSLGDDGLVIAWQGNPLVPRAWAVFDGARFVLAHDEDVIVGGPGGVTLLDRDTLDAREAWPADGAVDCTGAEVAWSWSEREGTTRLHAPGDVATIRGGAVPNTSAMCSLAGDDAWVAWFSGDSAHVLGYVGGTWMRAQVPWPWTTDPRVVPLDDGPRLFAIDDDGVPLTIDPRDGIALATTTPPPPRWRSCARFADGQVARCRVRDERITRASLTPPPFPAHAARVDAHGITLVAGRAWAHLAVGGEGPPVVVGERSMGITGYGVISDDIPLVALCRETATGGRFEAVDPTAGLARASLDWPAPCPERIWIDAESFAAAGPPGVVRWRDDGFVLTPAEHVVSTTPGFGRADVGLAVVNRWDTGCGSNADALWRTESGEPVELVYGPICDGDMALVTIDDGSGTTSGVALLTGERGRLSVARVELSGVVTDVVSVPQLNANVVRVALAGDAVWLDDVRNATTWRIIGTTARAVPLVAQRGDLGVRAEGDRLRISAPGGEATLVLDGVDLFVETDAGVWATPGLARRVAVAAAGHDGIVLGDDPGGALTWDPLALRAVLATDEAPTRTRNGFDGFGLIRRDGGAASE